MLLVALFLFLTPSAHAQVFDVPSELLWQKAREFQEEDPFTSEERVPLPSRGEKLIVEYSSSAPIELGISFPMGDPTKETLQVNPIHSLRIPDLQPVEQAAIAIDLTHSPAWSPWRKEYILHVRGSVDTVVQIYDIRMDPVTITQSISSIFAHFFLDEPRLLSSVNFLWGYRVWGASITLILGCAFLLTAALLRKSAWLLCAVLVFLAFYDARFSLDLARATAQDLSEWKGAHQYRQFGPLMLVADFLQEEKDVNVAMCFDLQDVVQKYLRYALYPIPVRRAEDNWGEATHLLFLATSRGSFDENNASCGDLPPRPVELLQEFPKGSTLFRFTDQ